MLAICNVVTLKRIAELTQLLSIKSHLPAILSPFAFISIAFYNFLLMHKFSKVEVRFGVKAYEIIEFPLFFWFYCWSIATNELLHSACRCSKFPGECGVGGKMKQFSLLWGIKVIAFFLRVKFKEKVCAYDSNSACTQSKVFRHINT